MSQRVKSHLIGKSLYHCSYCLSERIPCAFSYSTSVLEPWLGVLLVFNCSHKGCNMHESCWDHSHLLCWPFLNVYLTQQLVRLSPYCSVREGCCLFWRLLPRMTAKMFSPTRVWKRKPNVSSLPLWRGQSTHNLLLGTTFLSYNLVITDSD